MKKNICILLCTIFVITLSGCLQKNEPVKLYYYYFNACGACNEGGKFYDMADSALKGIDSSKYQIIAINVFKDTNPEPLRLFLKDNKLDKEDISYPILVAGSNYIIGYENIERGIRELVQSRIDNTDFKSVNGREKSLEGYQKQGDTDTDIPAAINKSDSYFVYFYTPSCNDCNSTQALLKTLAPVYSISVGGKTVNSSPVIEHKNIVEKNSLSQLENLFDYYHVPKDKREVPVMFYSKGYISGYKDIKKNMEKIIKEGQALNFDYSLINSKRDIDGLKPENIPGIFVTGLINGLNPCSISMLFLLLSLVISKKYSILKIGFSYIFGKMVAYFSFGIATYSIITIIDSPAFRNLQYGISLFMVIISLILALMNFRDAYWARKESYNNVKMQLPGSLRKHNHRIISYFAEKADSGWAVILIFVLGVIISMGEFLCTGQIYVATIVYLAQNTSHLTSMTVISFVSYVIAVSAPLIMLVILIYRTKRLLSISEFVRRHLPIIKIIFGLTFLVFGVIFLLYII